MNKGQELQKQKFLKKHKKKAQKILTDMWLKMWLTPNGNAFIYKARTEIGYSPNTIDRDIYSSLLSTFKRMKKRGEMK